MKNHWLNDKKETPSEPEWAVDVLMGLSIDGEKLLCVHLLQKYKDDPEVLNAVNFLTATLESKVTGDIGGGKSIPFPPEAITHFVIGCDPAAEVKDKKSLYGEICKKCGEEKWPMNTATTMMQGDPMCACHRNDCDLSIWYSSQFVQNEEPEMTGFGYSRDWMRQEVVFNTWFKVEHTPILRGTMLGSVFVGAEKTQEFTVDSHGSFSFGYVAPWTKENLELMSIREV